LLVRGLLYVTHLKQLMTAQYEYRAGDSPAPMPTVARIRTEAAAAPPPPELQYAAIGLDLCNVRCFRWRLSRYVVSFLDILGFSFRFFHLCWTMKYMFYLLVCLLVLGRKQ